MGVIVGVDPAFDGLPSKAMFTSSMPFAESRRKFTPKLVGMKTEVFVGPAHQVGQHLAAIAKAKLTRSNDGELD